MVIENKARVLVWLDDDWARRILGAPSRGPELSRWLAMGSVVDSAQEGIWLNSGRIEEWLFDGARVAWKFSNPTLLLRWVAIITVQIVEGDGKDIGFKPDR